MQPLTGKVNFESYLSLVSLNSMGRDKYKKPAANEQKFQFKLNLSL